MLQVFKGALALEAWQGELQAKPMHMFLKQGRTLAGVPSR
jgi:hypothetical protein